MHGCVLTRSRSQAEARAGLRGGPGRGCYGSGTMRTRRGASRGIARTATRGPPPDQGPAGVVDGAPGGPPDGTTRDLFNFGRTVLAPNPEHGQRSIRSFVDNTQVVPVAMRAFASCHSHPDLQVSGNAIDHTQTPLGCRGPASPGCHNVERQLAGRPPRRRQRTPNQVGRMTAKTARRGCQRGSRSPS